MKKSTTLALSLVDEFESRGFLYSLHVMVIVIAILNALPIVVVIFNGNVSFCYYTLCDIWKLLIVREGCRKKTYKTECDEYKFLIRMNILIYLYPKTIRTNIRIYSYQKNNTNEYPNIFVSKK